MEGARSEGDELIADYVDCLMSLDTNARSSHNDSLVLGDSVVEGVPNFSIGGAAEPDVMKDFAPAEDPNEPVLGMTFESDEAAKEFYNEYARRLGFPFRVGRSRRSKGTEEVLVMKRFVCSREGMYKKKQPSSDDATRKRERMSMRDGCNAMMEVVRESDHWVVSKLEKAHNHELGTCTKVGYLRARGLLGSSDKVTIVGPDDMAFLRQNVLGEGGDVQGLLDYLKKMQANDPAFFHAVQVDKNGCVVDVFWADARARAAYQHFGDAVTFDTTYKKNKYMMPFVTFAGVNHHLLPVIFGCALLMEETEFSLVWLFETWLTAMGGKAPCSLVTDQNRAIKAAVGKVFPNSCHRFCKWNILSRTKQKLSHIYTEHPNLRDELESCVLESQTISRFETTWMSIIDKYDLRKNSWLQTIYNIRQKWVPLYLTDTFFADISPTLKLETMNDFYKKYFNTKITFEVFLTQFDLTMASRYENEAQADMDGYLNKSSTKTASLIEKQAARTYTKAVFSKFQEEFTESLGYIIQKTKDGCVSKYTITKEENPSETFYVTYNAYSKMANCSCKYFEFSGILCRHILGVYIIVDPHTLPSDYLLKRWTKKARDDDYLLEDNHDGDAFPSIVSRYNVLCADALRCAVPRCGVAETVLSRLLLDSVCQGRSSGGLRAAGDGRQLDQMADGWSRRCGSCSGGGVWSGSGGAMWSRDAAAALAEEAWSGGGGGVWSGGGKQQELAGRAGGRKDEGGASSLSPSGGEARLSSILSNPRQARPFLCRRARPVGSSRQPENRAGSAPAQRQIQLARWANPRLIPLRARLSAASRADARLRARLAPPTRYARFSPAPPHRRGVVPSLHA